MPRRARIDAPGALHHVICRGIERRKIFREDSDRDDTKYLNRIFVVERGRYDELGLLMIVTMTLGLVLPIAAVWLLRPDRAGRRPLLRERLKPLKALTGCLRLHPPSPQEK